MKNKIIIFGLVLILLVGSVNAMSIDEFLLGYNFDYSSNDVSVTSYSDTGIDTGGSALFEQLRVNVNMNTGASTYEFIGELIEGNKLIETIKISETYFSGANSAAFNFNAKLLDSTDYKFSVRAYENNKLILRLDTNYSMVINPALYSTKDILVAYSSDLGENTEDDSRFDQLKINLELNSTINDNVDIYAYVYDENNNVMNIKQTNTITIAVGQNIPLIFSSKLLRERRLNGSLILKKVVVVTSGQTYDFALNQTLSTYQLADFDPKKTLVTDVFQESNVTVNDEIERVLITFDVEVNQTAEYNLKSSIFDMYGNFVSEIDKNVSLTSGVDSATIVLNYTDVSSSKVSGPYLISYIKLSKSGEVVDYVRNPYITLGYSYLDFKALPMPELVINNANVLDVTLNYTDVNVTIENSGTAVALNTKVSIFDGYAELLNEDVIERINPGEIVNHLAHRVNISNASSIKIILDINNEIIEINDSNNNYEFNINRDFVAPIITVINPTSNVSGSETAVNITTNENAVCKHDGSGSFSEFSITGGLAHSFLFSGLSAGIYNLNIECVDGNNNIETLSHVISVTPIDALSVGINANPTSGTGSVLVSYASVVSGGVAPYTYAWDIENDGTVDATSSSGSHTYSVGTYTLKLTVTDSNSNSLSSTQTISVAAIPDLSLSISASPLSGTGSLSVNYNSVVSGGVSPYTYAWDYESDGTIDATSSSGSNTYSVGTYTLKLTVTDNVANSVSKTIVVSVAEVIPFTCSAQSSPATGMEPLFVDLTSSVSNGLAPYTYSWDLDNDGDEDWSQSTVNLPYFAGTNIIKLRITDANNKICNTEVSVIVTAPPADIPEVFAEVIPSGNFATHVGKAPFTVKLNSSATGGSNSYSSYKWDIDNDGVDEYLTKNISHTYSVPGEYVAKVTICDSDNNCNSTTLEFDILSDTEYEELRNIGVNMKTQKDWTEGFSNSETINFEFESTRNDLTQYRDFYVREFSPYGNIVFDNVDTHEVFLLASNIKIAPTANYDLVLSNYPNVFTKTSFYEFMACDSGKICESMYKNSVLIQVTV